MSGLLDILGPALDDQAVQQMSRQVGAAPNQVEQALQMALPALIGGLARSATQPQGAEEIAGAIQRDQHGQILDNLGGYLQGNPLGRAANGAGILEHVLGPGQQPVRQGIAQATGLEPGVVAKLLQLLAPIVMGALSRSARQHQDSSPEVNPGAVQDVLTRAQERVRQQAPQGFDLVNRLLDANHDGSAIDELARMGQGLLGGLLGGKK